jgi:hypothetical protein
MQMHLPIMGMAMEAMALAMAEATAMDMALPMEAMVDTAWAMDTTLERERLRLPLKQPLRRLLKQLLRPMLQHFTVVMDMAVHMDMEVTVLDTEATVSDMDVLMDMDTPPMVIMAVDMDTTWERGPLKLRLLLPLRQLPKQKLMLMPQLSSMVEEGMEVTDMEVTDMEATVTGTEATVLDTDVPTDMDTRPMVMAMAMATTDKKSALHSSQK